MARFILVHGAWHGGWCWEDIAPQLTALGHDVFAPDLPGMGTDAGSGHVATLDEWAMFVAGMASVHEEPAILVGHSRGGIVISRAAEIAPKAVRRLVYIAAVMALPGESMGDVFEAGQPESAGQLADAIAVSPDGQTMTWHAREAAFKAFYGTTPIDRATAAFARLTPEPASMRSAPIALSENRYGSLPRDYIRCEKDQSVSPALQQFMIARQPCTVHSLETDHSPFYSAPIELSALLHEIASN